MAAAQSAKPVETGTSEDGGVLTRLTQLAWQAVPAIGSAIGFAGFVAVIGAAIEWIRFDAAGLPATQAVLEVPRQELVIIGALALAAFVLAGAFAVIFVYLIDNNGNATLRTIRAIVAVGVIEMLVTLCFVDSGASWGVYLVLGFWLSLVGFFAADLAGEAMRDFRTRSKLKDAAGKVVEARDALSAARAASGAATEVASRFPRPETLTAREQADLGVAAAQGGWQRSLREWKGAAEDISVGLSDTTREQIRNVINVITEYGDEPPGEDALASQLGKAEVDTGHVFRSIRARATEQLSALRELLHDTLARDPAGLGAVILYGLLSAAGALFIAGVVILAVDHVFAWLAIMLGIVALLTIMNVLIARATERFAWYGITVFFSVLMFGAALTIVKELYKPSVQPIALVRKSDRLGVCGVFITQTSDRVYIGRLKLTSRTGELVRPGLIFWVPTDDVDLVDVGQSERINPRLPVLAEKMLAQLYKDRAEAAAPSVKNTTITEVVGSEVKPGATEGKQVTTTREVLPDVAQAKVTPTVSSAGSAADTSCTATDPSTASSSAG